MTHQVNGDASRVPYATRAELEAVEEKLDASVQDIRIANAGIQRLLRGQEAMSAAIARIEQRLAGTEAKAEQASYRAEMASRPDETAQEIARIHLQREKAEADLELEKRRDSIRARQGQREALFLGISAVGKWALAGLTPLIVVALLFKACGVNVELPHEPQPQPPTQQIEP